MFCRSCNDQIRVLRHIRPCITAYVAATVASSIIGSRLDYCNSIINGFTVYNIDRLQRVQNTLARVVTKSNSRASAWPFLHKLHWLPVRQRIKYKLAVTTFKAFCNHTPDYLSGLLHEFKSGRSLRSSNSSLLAAPIISTVESGRAYKEIWHLWFGMHFQLSSAPCCAICIMTSRNA